MVAYPLRLLPPPKFHGGALGEAGAENLRAADRIPPKFGDAGQVPTPP
jgi:hypothetical protein